jgi:hypothetical protein
VADLRPPVTEADCKLIGAGDGSVMVYCQPCRACLCPRATTLNAAAGFWEEHCDQAHEPAPAGEWTAPTPDPWAAEVCRLCGRIPAEGEAHRQVYGGGPDGDDVEEQSRPSDPATQHAPSGRCPTVLVEQRPEARSAPPVAPAP